MTQIGMKFLDVFKLYIDLAYISKSVIISSIYCFTEQFKNLNTFTVLFQGLKLPRNFGMFINYRDMFYIPKSVIVFRI